MGDKGLSTVASAIIIGGMIVAITVVFIIIYNIVSTEVEYSTESNISLQIQKDSVLIDENNKVSLMITREAGDAELEKIKFVLFDGENLEEIERKATDLGELEEMEFTFTPKLVTNISTISVVPIITVDGKRKYLPVASSIKIQKQESGGTIIEEESVVCGNAKLETGEQCDDGNLVAGDGCSVTCKTETTTPTTTPTTNQSSTTSTCGNSVVNSGEQCDSGSSNGVACSASYGTNCTYCSSGCVNVIVQGARCGDSTCNSPTEAYASCPGDCPLCTAGQTQQCGSTDVGACAFGTQTCSAEKTWGSCIGSVTPVAEDCDSGLDKDCDGLIDCADSGCNGQTCASGKVCSGGNCIVSCTDDCSPSGTKTCDGTGYKTCGNYDADSCLEWSSTTSCGTCGTCSGGNCVTSPDTTCGQGLYGCTGGGSYCSSGTCITKTANGQVCSTGTDCCSGYCYIDGDGDRYAGDSGSKTCRAYSQLGATDCCDSDGNTYPGQTSYFPALNGCGSWDYNCDSSTTKRLGFCSKITSGPAMSGTCDAGCGANQKYIEITCSEMVCGESGVWLATGLVESSTSSCSATNLYCGCDGLVGVHSGSLQCSKCTDHNPGEAGILSVATDSSQRTCECR